MMSIESEIVKEANKLREKYGRRNRMYMRGTSGMSYYILAANMRVLGMTAREVVDEGISSKPKRIPLP